VLAVAARGAFDLRLTATADCDVLDARVEWTVRDAAEVALATKSGRVEQIGDAFAWNIGALRAGRAAELAGTVAGEDGCRAFRLRFRIDGKAVSGSEIGPVLVDGGEPGAFLGVRYETHAGRFELRTGLP